MVQYDVKARRVGDSVVITLTKPILDGTGIAESDSLSLEVLGEGRILVSKGGSTVSAARRLQLELEVLRNRRDAIEAEMHLGVLEHNLSMPTAHPGIERDDLMEGYARQWTWQSRKLDVEIAEKRLQLFELTGQED